MHICIWIWNIYSVYQLREAKNEDNEIQLIANTAVAKDELVSQPKTLMRKGHTSHVQQELDIENDLKYQPGHESKC